MPHKPQARIPATYMRGGTSKGVFFCLNDLPPQAQVPGPARDQLLLKVIGSPDPYAKHIDGMGGATSSTSKVVIVSPSEDPNHDIDYLFGQVSIDQPFIDWSGNCGNLSSAVGAFAIHRGLLNSKQIPHNGLAEVRIWQANIEKTIIAHIPITHSQVQETGDFMLDGVTFASAEIKLEFIQPVDEKELLFPTGNIVDELRIPGLGVLKATLINAGIPSIFVNAEEIGYSGTESQDTINSNPSALAQFETIRAWGAKEMGLIDSIEQIKSHQHTPKIAFIAKPTNYLASNGKPVQKSDIDLCVRALSMGKLHHAMMGTCAVAIGTAAAIPGTLVNLAAGGGELASVNFGHPSGTLKVGAQTTFVDQQWMVNKVTMSRSARILMDGWVYFSD